MRTGSMTNGGNQMKAVTSQEMAGLIKRLSEQSGDSVSISIELWHHSHTGQPSPMLWKLWFSATEERHDFPSYAALEHFANDYLSRPVEAIEEAENV